MEITTIGLDLAKPVFQVQGANREGLAVLRKRLRRAEVEGFFRALPPCLVGMAACGTAHYWARLIGSLGHAVRLLPPLYGKPYVKRARPMWPMPRRSARQSRVPPRARCR